MTYEQIEMAINAHIETCQRLKKARLSAPAGGLAEHIEREFELRRVLVEGRGDSTQTEIRRVTYILGFIIASQVSDIDRLADDVAGASM